jgi:hypothetical protein
MVIWSIAIAGVGRGVGEGGAGVGVMVGVCVGVGVSVGVGVREGVKVAVAVGVTVGVWVAVGVRVSVGVGVAVGSGAHPAMSSAAAMVIKIIFAFIVILRHCNQSAFNLPPYFTMWFAGVNPTSDEVMTPDAPIYFLC